MSKRNIHEKIQLYEDTRSAEESHIRHEEVLHYEAEQIDDQHPAKKYSALLCGFNGIHPERSRVSLCSSGGNETTEFSTELQPLENLRKMAFSTASSKSFVVNGDTPLKDIRIVAEYNDGNLPESTLSSKTDSSNTKSSITWFYKPGEFFRNALAFHKDIAKDRATADAAGRTLLKRMERHVTCISPSHVAFYLFEPMKWVDTRSFPVEKVFEERYCVNDEKCVARRFMPHPNAKLTEAEILKNNALKIIHSGGAAPKFQWNKNAPRGGIILKEFLNEEERNLFQITGQLPPERGPCILCMRAAWTFDFFTSTLNNRVAHIGHYHPIDVKDGYKKSACLPFAKPITSKGVTMPVRYFDPANDYHPATLSESFANSLVPLWRNEQIGLKQICDTYNDTLVALEIATNRLKQQQQQQQQQNLPDIESDQQYKDEIVDAQVKVNAAKERIPNGYVEDGSVYFFATTRWLSQQASSMGAEPMITYVPMHNKIAYQLPGNMPLSKLSHSGGLWDHLIDVFVAHTARSRLVIKTLLRPFSESWLSVRTALIDNTSNHELADMIRSLPYWSSIGSPSRLSSYSIVATSFARKLLVDELRANMARKIDHIAVEKIIRKNYATHNKSANPTEMPLTPMQLEIINRRGGLGSNDPEPSSIVASKNVTQRGGNTDMKVLKPETMAAANERLKLSDRCEKHSDALDVNADEQNRRVKFDSSRSTLQYHDDVLRETSEFSISCRPICRWLCAQVNNRCPVDDNSLVGIDLSLVLPQQMSETGTFDLTVAEKYIKSALGDLNPDMYAPTRNTRREFISTHIDPEPEYGPCACPQHVARWVFPSHREIILNWLTSEPSLHFNENISIKTQLSVLLNNESIITLPLIDVFDTFWRLAWQIRNNSSSYCVTLKLLDGKDITKYSIAAALILRVRVLEKLILLAIDITTVYPIREFLWSHNDLYSLVFSNERPLSDHKLMSMFTPNGQCMMLDAVYPYDGRNNIDSNTPSLTTLLLNCGFFEQISDVVSIHTILHAFEKIVPRACQSRESHTVTSQACIENISFAKIVMRIIKMTLIGAYPHAKYSWDDGIFIDIKKTLVACRIVEYAERDTLLRADEKKNRSAFQKTEIAKVTIEKCINLFGMDAVRFTLQLADVFSDIVTFNTPATIIGKDMITPFYQTSIDLRSLLTDAIIHELSYCINEPKDIIREFLITNVLSSYDTFVSYLYHDECDNDDDESHYKRYIVDAIKVISMSGFTETYDGMKVFNKYTIGVIINRIMTSFNTEIKEYIDIRKVAYDPHQIENALNTSLMTIGMYFEGQPNALLLRDEKQTIIILTDTVYITLKSVLSPICAEIVNLDKLNSLCFKVATESISHVNRVLIYGLPRLVLQLIVDHSIDLLDVASTCHDVIHSIRDTTTMCDYVYGMINSYSILWDTTILSTEFKCDMLSWLSATTTTTTTTLQEHPINFCVIVTGIAERNRRRRRLLSGKDLSFDGSDIKSCIEVIKCVNKDILERDAKPNRINVINGLINISKETVSDAIESIQMARTFQTAISDCYQMRSGTLSYYNAISGLDKTVSFVDKNPTLIHYAIREALAAGISRNPILCEGFCNNNHRKWFPEFLDHTVQVCNWIRYTVAKTGNVPCDNELGNYADEMRRYKWGDRVFRLYKYSEAVRMAKTFNQVDSTFSKIGVDIAKIATRHLSKLQQEKRFARRKLLLEYVMSEHLAHRSVETDCNIISRNFSNHERDMDVLCHFGMREHGCAVLSTIHKAFVNFAGSNELAKIAEDFTIDEFILVSEYFVALNSANAINIVPLRCRQWSEATVAALCEKHSFADTEPVIHNLVELYTCSSCCSVSNQITSSACTRHFDLSSCYSVSSNQSGLWLCANRRDLSKKKDVANWDKLTNTLSPLQRVGNLLPPCQIAKIRQLDVVGRVIEFFKKYGSKGEKNITESKSPIIMTPCCGKLVRFQKDDWGSDGYRCVACSYARRTDWALPNNCIVCGLSLSSTSSVSSATRGKRTNNRDRSSAAIYIDMVKRREQPTIGKFVRDILQNRMHNSIVIGHSLPVTPCSYYIIFVIDDDVTFGLIPVGLCKQCSHDRQILGTWPRYLSTIRGMATKRIEQYEQRVAMRKNCVNTSVKFYR